jgi:HK97 family phage prohead protease
MLWGIHQGDFEVRGEGGETRLLGRFPYGAETVLRPAGNGGPELREVFAPRAFAVDQTRNTFLLAGHDFAKPMASVAAASLQVTNTDAALLIEARITPEMMAVSYIADMLAGIRAGLVPGISPGFRVASQAGAETITRQGNTVLRTISAAVLEEISIVTRPAYPQSQIEARCWESHQDRQPVRGAVHPFNRWRA